MEYLLEVLIVMRWAADDEMFTDWFENADGTGTWHYSKGGSPNLVPVVDYLK